MQLQQKYLVVSLQSNMVLTSKKIRLLIEMKSMVFTNYMV